jgi:hypothetical protein
MKIKPQLTKNQLVATATLLKNLKDFADKKYGSISNVLILQHHGLPNTILVKYEKNSSIAGERSYEYRIASVNQEGKTEFIDNKFKDIFERAAFLSESIPLNIDDEKQYDKID